MGIGLDGNTPRADAHALHQYDRETAALAERVRAFCVERGSHAAERLGPPPTAEALAAALAGAVSPDGMGFERAFDLFTEVVAPACQSPDHPRFLAFVPAAPAPAASLFDAALSAAGILGSSWLEAAGATAAENQAIRWLADLAGLPARARGVFLGGATIGNLNALAVARHWWRERRGDSSRRLSVAVSAETHSSVRMALRVLELDALDVPADGRGRMTGDAVGDVLDRVADRVNVCAVVATAGITNLGLVDDLAGIATAAADRDVWFHVDGAYGGAALASFRTRPLFDGIERADSLVIDPHKWMFAPFDCSALIYRTPALARATFSQDAAYLDPLQSAADPNPCDLAAHLTRRARGLPFWFTLVGGGERSLTAAIEHGLDLAAAMAAEVRQSECLELVVEPELSVVVVRRRGWGAEDYVAWSERQLASGHALVLPTTWRGEPLMRFCFVNPRTTMHDARELLRSMSA